MQSSNQPGKFLIPFAQNDSAKVEIPATTTDATRFSQSLGSPPLTGMPPEAGGVPPQLEDFNGALNQQSRVAWWMFSGNRFGFDPTWAADPLINGYARGAVLPAALGAGLIGMGEWYNNVEDNAANPDTVGTGWVPGYHYGATALTGQAGGTVTLSPAQAAKRVLTIAGTLTSNLVLVVPGWVYDWTIYNNTGGAFTVTVKNAATPGVTVPQNGAPTLVRCDGSACSLLAPNIGPAVSDTQALQYGQASGRLINVQRFTASGTYTPTAGTKSIIVELQGGGGGGGGVSATDGTQVCGGVGAGAGAYLKLRFTTVAAAAVVVGAGGAGGAASTVGGTGSPGNTSSFGTSSVSGGDGGRQYLLASSTPPFPLGGGNGGMTLTPGTGTVLVQSHGSPGGAITYSAALASALVGGVGGPSMLGFTSSAAPGTPPANSGAGGSGAANPPSTAGKVGGAGAAGVVVVYEYA